MKSDCVVSVATGRYRVGQERLGASLAKNGFSGDVLKWLDKMPPGSPSHSAVPYAFKLHALAEARRLGYRRAFWFDTSVFAIKPIEPLFEIVEKQGYCLWDEGGWSIGQWCTDAALAKLGIGREEAFKIPLTLSKVVGIDFQHPLAASLFESWFAHAVDGISFLGPWRNDNGAMSSDPHVLGHRHDMPPLAFHAQRLGMKHFPNNHMFEFWSASPKPETILLARGVA